MLIELMVMCIMYSLMRDKMSGNPYSDHHELDGSLHPCGPSVACNL
jgi:hypothetical protein